jgi:ADP-ribose pyrophosphatase YjhB (NUDIX family)
MENLLPTIRNVARAVIVKDGQLLVQLKSDNSYALPGGAMEIDENLEQALKRECFEEIGCQITIQQLLCLAEYYKPKTSSPPAIQHQLEFFFLCQVPENYIAANGPEPDKRQIDVLWLPLTDLSTVMMKPVAIKDWLVKRLSESSSPNSQQSLYLGVLN